MQLWDLNDILQVSENSEKGKAAMSDSDGDEMDMDDNPSRSKKGVPLLFSFLPFDLSSITKSPGHNVASL